MPDITLADGLPVWEGAAVLFGSPGKTHRGRHFVHGFEAGRVHLGHEHFAPADALVLDLSHRPTGLDLAYRAAVKHGACLDVDPTADVEVEFWWADGPSAPIQVGGSDLAAFYLNGPAPAPG